MKKECREKRNIMDAWKGETPSKKKQEEGKGPIVRSLECKFRWKGMICEAIFGDERKEVDHLIQK